MTNVDPGPLTARMFLRHLLSIVLVLPPAGFLVPSLFRLPESQPIRGALWASLLVLLVAGLMVPFLAIRVLVGTALASSGEGDRSRLERLLEVSGALELSLTGSIAAGALVYLLVLSMLNGTSIASVVQGTLAIALVGALVMMRQRVGFERMLQPIALEELQRSPQVRPSSRSLFGSRQSWYVPYGFALLGGATALFVGSTSAQAPTGASAFVGGYLVLLGAWVAWGVASSQREGALSVRRAIESLAAGKPELPKWIASDEVGELAVVTRSAFEQLKSFSEALRESATALSTSAKELGASSTQQNEVLTTQAAALQETQVTAQEIRQTSILAAQKAEGVIQKTERAGEISKSGEAAIEQSLSGLTDIREQVKEMAERIRALDERARQIANITTTVKDLADQSNMLALNAAIEAVRSGEHGKGFGVVAREIRTLADQSIQATNNVREILQDLSEAIRSTVSITEKGAEKIERSLEQVKVFGDNMRQLSGIVKENAAAVRQISAAVTQQNAGIGQIFQAVNELTKMMDQTMERLRATDGATGAVQTAAEKVTGFMTKFGWGGDNRPESSAASSPPPNQQLPS